jgi:predicted nucleic acid-binding protein
VWAYFDTSVVVKRYIEEPGRREAVRLLRRYDFVASSVLPVELRSAFSRRTADGTLDAARVPDIVRRVAADRAYWTLVEVGAEVLTAAETLVATRSLRTLDAIHVASAQIFAARAAIPSMMFVSADRRQTDAAKAVGLAVRLLDSTTAL